MSAPRLKSRRRQDQGTKWARVLIAILSTIGVIDTGSITINKWGFLDSLSCPGGSQGCDKVLNSAWGNIFAANNFEIPLSLVGFLSYLILLVLAIIPFIPTLSDKKNNLSRLTWWGLFLVSSSMTVFSCVLIGIMILKIKAFCFFCILSALISLSILLLTLVGGGWDDSRELIYRGIILAIIVFLGALIWSSAVDPNNQKIKSSQLGLPPAITSVSSPSKISLAEHLNENNVVLYNAYWCPHCHEQKEMFGKEAVSKITLIECAPDGQNSQTELCQRKGIAAFPSWEINGKIESGVKSLDELAESTNYKGPRNF